MSVKHKHECRPLHVAGTLRATCGDHWWQPLPQTAVTLRIVR